MDDRKKWACMRPREISVFLKLHKNAEKNIQLDPWFTFSNWQKQNHIKKRQALTKKEVRVMAHNLTVQRKNVKETLE